MIWITTILVLGLILFGHYIHKNTASKKQENMARAIEKYFN